MPKKITQVRFSVRKGLTMVGSGIITFDTNVKTTPYTDVKVNDITGFEMAANSGPLRIWIEDVKDEDTPLLPKTRPVDDDNEDDEDEDD